MTDDKEVKVTAKLTKIIEEVEKLTVLELADLVKALEEKFGVSASPAVVGSRLLPPRPAPCRRRSRRRGREKRIPGCLNFRWRQQNRRY